MHSGEQLGFRPKDLEDVANMYSVIDEEQNILPTWLRGLPLTSAPAELYYDMVDQQEELEQSGLPQQDFQRQYTDISRRIALLVDFHKRHRDLMTDQKEPHDPDYALRSAKSDINHLLALAIHPYEGWDIIEYSPFLEVLHAAYLSFYYPHRDTLSY